MEDILNNLSNLSEEQRKEFFSMVKEQGVNIQDFPITAQSTDSNLPLSFAQERLWFLNQMFQGDASDNIPVAFRLLGPIHLNALEQAFNLILERHQILRCNFKKINKGVVQDINHNIEFEISVRDYSDKPVTDDMIQELVGEEARHSFNFETVPFLKVSLFKIDHDHHILLINMHHIISDGWSMLILYRELSEIYSAIINNRPPELPPLDIQYPDYANWQRSLYNEELLGDQINYWTKRLKGIPEAIELPKDNPRPGVQNFKGRKFPISIEDQLLNKIKKLARENGCTLFMTLSAALKVLLHKYTGQQDIVIGTPIANRDKPETEHLIGLFLNMLVLRGDLAGDPNIKELLSRTKSHTLEAYENQMVPFEKLVEKIQPTRDMSYHPLFQVILQISPQHNLTLEGLQCRLFHFDSGTSQYDLALHLFEGSEDLHGYFEYNHTIFNQATIKRMVGHFKELLRSMVANPQVPISQLKVITDQEIELIDKWNDTKTDYPSVSSLIELFERQVGLSPDSIAIEFEGEKLSYSQMNERTNQVAHYLQDRGVAVEQMVGVFMERSIEMVVAIYGILKAGGAYLPIDPGYPQDRVDFIINDANLSLILTTTALFSKLPKCESELLAVDQQWELIDQYPDHNPDIDICSTDLAYVIYTSGSTGKPKGVMNEHGAICNRLMWMQERFKLQEDDCILQKTPFSFDVSVWELFWPLLYGARLVIAKPEGHKDNHYLIGLIKRSNITTIHFVPSMLQVFIDNPEVRDCPSLRRVICSGEALSYELQQQFFKVLPCELYNLYGPTEAAVDVTCWKCDRESHLKRVPIGKPISNTQTYILDDNLNLAPIGVPGELYLGGVQIARGYLNRPQLTAERFLPDPFSQQLGSRIYKTGDLVRYLEDGSIDYLGRRDYQVKVRGFRIELGEIESAIRDLSNAKECCVVVREDDPGDKRLVAYMVGSGQTEGVNRLRSSLKKRLPEYMVPSAFMVLEAFPLTPNGKLDRKALPKPAATRDQATEFTPPKNEVERIIAEIWKNHLSIAKVGSQDNFFDLGGHSLLMISVHSDLEERFNRKISIIELYKFPTISMLASFISREHIDQNKNQKISARASKQQAQRKIRRQKMRRN